MGVDYNIYYGAVIVAQNKMLDDNLEVLGCPKCKTKNARDRFCPECGTQISLIPSQKRIRAINVWNLMDICNEDLYHIDRHMENLTDYYIPNKRNDTLPCMQFEPTRYDIDVDIMNVDILKGIEEFKKIYGKQIEFVENEYGKENVKIEWRLFNWAH